MRARELGPNVAPAGMAGVEMDMIELRAVGKKADEEGGAGEARDAGEGGAAEGGVAADEDKEPRKRSSAAGAVFSYCNSIIGAGIIGGWRWARARRAVR